MFGSISGLIIVIIIEILFCIYVLIDSLFLCFKNKNYQLKKINKWYIYLIIFLLFSFIYYILNEFVILKFSRYQSYISIGSSNEPTLIIKERIISDNWYYKFNKLKHGDMVVFHNPENEPDAPFIIKRCVGLQGDKVEIKNFQLFLNNKLIDAYKIKIDDEYIKMSKEIDGYENYGTVIVPDNTFFCLGDNRTNSMDSRGWGFIDNKLLIGKGLYIYWSKDLSRIGDKL